MNRQAVLFSNIVTDVETWRMTRRVLRLLLEQQTFVELRLTAKHCCAVQWRMAVACLQLV